MKTITLDNFSGGLAEDIRSHSTNVFNDAKGFDTLSFTHRLIPYGEQETESLSSGDITDKRISDIIREANGVLVAVGRNSSGSPTVIDLLDKDSDTDISSSWTSFTTLSGAGGYMKNSFAYYKNKYYVLDASLNLRRYDGSWSNVGTLDTTTIWSTMPIPRPIVHPMDDIMYLGAGQYMAKVNNTTYNDITAVVIPTTHYITSFADYDSYLAIAAAYKYEGGKSRVFLWNRDTSLSTFTSNIDWGEGSLMILENLAGTLVGISISDANFVSQPTYTVVKNKKLTVRALSGNQAIKIAEIEVSSDFSLKNYKAVVGNKLYFSGDNADSLYVVQKKENGTIVFSKDRYINNGSTITTLNGLNIFGDYLFTMFDTGSTSGNFYRTKVTPSYTSTSVYETTINPNMDLSDRTHKKKLKSISISKASTTGQLVIKYSADGSAYTTIATLTAGSKLVLKATNESTGKPLADAYEYQFKIESTAGAQLTEVKYAYEVVPELI